MNRIIGIALTVLLITTAFAGGGWVKTKKTAYHKFGFSYVTSNGYFSGGNDYSPSLNSSLFTASFYTETGIGEKISFEGYLPYYTRHSVSGSFIDSEGLRTELNDVAGGVGDALVGLRFQLFKNDFLAVAGTAKLGLPIGSAALGDNGNLFTGDDEFNQIVRLDASVPFGGKKVGGFVTGYAGFNNRANVFSNETMYGAELGFSYLPADIWLIAKLDAVRPNNEAPQEFSNGFTSSMSFTNLIIETAYLLTDKHGLTASYTHSIDGNVLLVAPAVSFGGYINIQ